MSESPYRRAATNHRVACHLYDEDVPSPTAIWTIGHSNHSFERFAELLRSERIEFIVDVRSFPYSRYAPQFNREQLEADVPRRAVRYLYLGAELGGRPTSEEHYDADGHALYGLMSEQASFRKAIERLIDGARRHRIALLCSEGDPSHCHRRLLVGKVLTGSGLELRHILTDGSVRVEAAVVLPTESGQCSLLDPQEDRWRSTQSVSHRRRLSVSSSA